MTQIATTIEQSKKLIELGIDVHTADMHYSKWDKEEEEEYHLKCGGLPKLDFKYAKNIPAWSLSKLLELMPLPLLTQHNNNRWYMVTYPNGKHIGLEEYDNPIDAAFEMMCYLLENKMI